MVECSKKKELRHFSFVRKCLFDNFRPHISGLNSITSFSVYFEEDFFHLVVDENPWSNLAKEDDHQEGKELGEKSEKKANTKSWRRKSKRRKSEIKKEALPTDRAKHPGGLFPSSTTAKEAHDGHLCKLASIPKIFNGRILNISSFDGLCHVLEEPKKECLK